MKDVRAKVAKFYDAATTQKDDISFYESQIPKDDPTVLELGCGTGRVTIPLAMKCDAITGVDSSEAMLNICKEKLERADVPADRVQLICTDIAKMKLERTFGLIIAPYRVFQNIATDEAVEDLFSVIREHLSPNGACILNVFNPRSAKADLMKKWNSPEEILEEEIPYKSGFLRQYVIKNTFTEAPFVLYPELIYRYFEGNSVKDEARFEIPMRVYYPDEFKKTIEDQGFKIVESWGGYNGAPYGSEKGDLVVKFKCK